MSHHRENSEAAFHDAWAESVDPMDVQVDAIESACTMPETRYILSQVARFQVQSATPSPWVLASSKKTS